MTGGVYHLIIAGIGIRLALPGPLPEELEPFRGTDGAESVSYELEIISCPLSPQGNPAHQGVRQTVYRVEGGWLRLFSGQTAGLRLTPDGRNTLYLHRDDVCRYQRPYSIIGLLGAEYPLLWHGRIILHSSLVLHRGRVILFSGPSGVGKSTQAALWQQYAGAQVLNGDRAVIDCAGGIAHGSPFSGSSGIRIQAAAPIRAIVFLEQGEQNLIAPVSPLEAYRRLYSQVIANPWDSDYTEKLCNLIEILIRQNPMYRFTCRPDGTAVAALMDCLKD